MTDLKNNVLAIGQEIMTRYWGPMYRQLRENPALLDEAPGFLMAPEKLVFYFGQTHLGIEYIGPERITKIPEGEQRLETQVFDYTDRPDGLLNRIIGFDFSDGRLALPLPPVSTDLVVPTNAGFDKLVDLGWNWAAQDMVVGLNTAGVMAPRGQFTRIVNGRFFDSDAGGLKTRHIKWLDLVPVEYDDSDAELDSIRVPLGYFDALSERDLSFPYLVPTDFKFQRLPKINRFIELIGNGQTTEPEITRFLAAEEFQFILGMRFSASELHAERACQWADSSRPAIKPDFFVERSDGYADIVEFKLPDLKSGLVVGRPNRETFSAEIASYIAQTRVYREYFDDPRNRAWVEAQYGFKVYKPQRYLVAGRRADFSGEEWRAIAADFTDLHILSFDDLIDGVVVQFYR